MLSLSRGYLGYLNSTVILPIRNFTWSLDPGVEHLGIQFKRIKFAQDR